MTDGFVVYWNDHTAQSYLYGSEILFHARDDVEFRNLLMPPGTVINQWYSRTNYQMQRIEPTLPLIDGEGEYRITILMDCMPKEHFLFRLVFLDRYEKEAGEIYIRKRSTTFRCPLKTYSYRLELINSGMTQFRFHYIMIKDITDGAGEDI